MIISTFKKKGNEQFTMPASSFLSLKMSQEWRGENLGSKQV